jgi:hypothetical protein
MVEPRVAVIGAGPSGLACAKHLLQVGLRHFVVYEKNADVGGNWLYSPTPGHSSAYAGLCAITSKRMSAYEDFPMPDDYPEYPRHDLLLAYFRAYARRFGLYDFIRFHTEVRQLNPIDGDRWQVTLADGQTETFDYILVASGHHWDPYVPAWDGTFEGTFLHSHEYREPEPFRGQRVLVIGGGNSACDIAVEVSRVARFTAISMRRGYHVIPKFVFWGLPADVLYARMQFIPRWVRQRLIRLALWLLVGSPERYGLLKPDHDVFQTHPIVNSELLYSIRHGRVHPRRDVRRFEGSRVHFIDGTVEEYDAVIAATGYRISFPFLTPRNRSDVPATGSGRSPPIPERFPSPISELVLHRLDPAEWMPLEPGRPSGPAGRQLHRRPLPPAGPSGGGHRGRRPPPPPPLCLDPSPHAGGRLARVPTPPPQAPSSPSAPLAGPAAEKTPGRSNVDGAGVTPSHSGRAFRRLARLGHASLQGNELTGMGRLGLRTACLVDE